MMALVRPAVEARADRFAIALPIRYRLCGLDSWADAATLNVSRTGVLVRCVSGCPLPSRDVSFTLALPPCGVVELARIRCQGRVVRV